MRRSIRMLVLALTALTGCVGMSSAPSTDGGAFAGGKEIHVVRHLQKAAGEDPALTSEGGVAAIRLADLLADKGVVAIFATPTRRTMETGAPLANRLGIMITPYDPRDPDALVSAISSLQGSVLVIGHSNTVPDLVERLGGRQVPELTEQDYGTLFTIDEAGQVRSREIG
ncbi:SixA phosphatase family protein [Qipengyuania spongiae]|uniref:Histidine phosphatase family protein n=1 Tax=Qipengyuania spongiae TaxID=2909673 RepID=A0ABY5SYS0_9SPHN|nr:histidine phosphatase family protein [Qipengyuania spongiae]UVI39475.1 histidine phosphatase family protein [Qipengyuania spongiae]